MSIEDSPKPFVGKTYWAVVTVVVAIGLWVADGTPSPEQFAHQYVHALGVVVEWLGSDET